MPSGYFNLIQFFTKNIASRLTVVVLIRRRKRHDKLQKSENFIANYEESSIPTMSESPQELVAQNSKGEAETSRETLGELKRIAAVDVLTRNQKWQWEITKG